MEIRELLARKGQKPDRVISSLGLQELAQQLLSTRAGAFVVVDPSDRPVGIVSERDLLDVIATPAADGALKVVADIMTTKLVTCTPFDKVSDVVKLMGKNNIRHVPVVENEKLIGVVSIRELTAAYENLDAVAHIDPLTGISNRRLFLENLDTEFERARRYDHSFSVAMIDIDHFKKVNDTFGHDVGDTVIRKIAEHLVTEFRTVDHIGRLGGEEFAVLFPETGLVGAATACQRLLNTVRSSPVDANEDAIKVTVSIGLSGLTKRTESGPELLKLSDEKLYEAKRGGRDCLVSELDDLNSHLQIAG